MSSFGLAQPMVVQITSTTVVVKWPLIATLRENRKPLMEMPMRLSTHLAQKTIVNISQVTEDKITEG